MKNLYIITGTSSGIGKALVELLLMDPKNRIIGISRNNIFHHANYSHYTINLAKIEETKNFNFPMNSNFNSIHLINNAGVIGEINTLNNIDIESIECSINTNYTSTMILSTKFIQQFQNINCIKTIINISSGAAHTPYASWANYCSSKAAIEMFSKCINIEQEEQLFKIKSFAIAPGIVDTNMQKQIRLTDDKYFKLKSKFIELYSNNMLFDPKFVAQKLIEISLSPALYTESSFRIEP